jgi:hypothetical protein
MPLVRSNFRRWSGLVTTVGVGGVAALPPSVAASGVTPTGMVFMSASQLYIWNGGLFVGWSFAPTIAGTGVAAGTSFSTLMVIITASGS